MCLKVERHRRHSLNRAHNSSHTSFGGKCDPTSDRALLTAERNTSLPISQPYFHNHTGGPMQPTPHVHTHVLNSAGPSLSARNKHFHIFFFVRLNVVDRRGVLRGRTIHTTHTQTHLSTAAFNTIRCKNTSRNKTTFSLRPIKHFAERGHHFHLAQHHHQNRESFRASFRSNVFTLHMPRTSWRNKTHCTDFFFSLGIHHTARSRS